MENTVDWTFSRYYQLLLLPLLLLPFLPACSAEPPEQFFKDDIMRMVLLERELGFREEITGIEILKRTHYEDQIEVQVRVTGWAVHPEITIGATLPASSVKKPSWAVWKYFCSKVEKKWVIDDKYKVEEGFVEQNSESRIQKGKHVSQAKSVNPKAEQIRKRYLYRRLVLTGDAVIRRETARKMVGPDCAYHLYGRIISPKFKSCS
jgi:hypothetical protein